jgi:hypothetical protein
MTLWIVGGFMFSVLAIVWVLYNMGQNVENKQRPCTAPAGPGTSRVDDHHDE